MKKWFGNILQALISMRLHFVAALLLSTVVSIADMRLTKARWDGEDWEFKWADGCLYSGSAVVRPKRVIGKNIGAFLSRYSPKVGDVILEVGAGNGTEVCSFSNIVGPSGMVVAIEADATAVRQLRKQAAVLRNQNVRVLGVAVGACDGLIELDVVEPGGLGNSTVAVTGSSTVTVRCRTLHSILAELGVDSVSYMKMNIEGAEYDALLGLGSAIVRVEEMCISCHDFTGVPAQRTFEKVRQDLELSTLPPNLGSPWEDFYIFARKKPERP